MNNVNEVSRYCCKVLFRSFELEYFVSKCVFLQFANYFCVRKFENLSIVELHYTYRVNIMKLCDVYDDIVLIFNFADAVWSLNDVNEFPFVDFYNIGF